MRRLIKCAASCCGRFKAVTLLLQSDRTIVSLAKRSRRAAAGNPPISLPCSGCKAGRCSHRRSNSSGLTAGDRDRETAAGGSEGRPQPAEDKQEASEDAGETR